MPYSNILQLLIALVLTIGLFFGLVLLMKKLQLGTGRGNSLITVLAALPLGSKDKVYLLEVAGEHIVVGTSAGGMCRLHTLDRTSGQQLPKGLADTATTDAATDKQISQTLSPFNRVLDAIRKGSVQ